jgi:hypothetical protein
MNSEEELSSNILSNVDIVADIYKIVKQCGINATLNAEVIKLEKDTTIIRADVPGLNRITANCRRPGSNPLTECRKSTSYRIKYDANDMVVVGGSALNIYDFLLKELKGRYKISALESYIKKKTSDIDIVWWPRSVTNASKNIIDKEIVTSSSPAIAKLVDELIRQLIIQFEENKKMIQSKLRSIIPKLTNTDILNIEIGGDLYGVNKAYHNYRSGTYTITIQFSIKGYKLKICEILVHDSGASQQYNEDGLEISDLRYMTNDVMFCSPVQSSSKSILYQTINGVDIGVPNILAFVRQQMLAFSNLIRNNKDRYGKWNFKGFINYKRVEFIKLLLKNITSNNGKNNIELLEIFKTTNRGYPLLIIQNIDSITEYNIKTLYSNILELCKNYNILSDTIINELCKKAKLEAIILATKKETPVKHNNNTRKYNINNKSYNSSPQLLYGIEPISVRSEAKENGTIIHYTPDNIPWTVSKLGQIVMRNPTTGEGEIVGQYQSISALHRTTTNGTNRNYNTPGNIQWFINEIGQLVMKNSNTGEIIGQYRPNSVRPPTTKKGITIIHYRSDNN